MHFPIFAIQLNMGINVSINILSLLKEQVQIFKLLCPWYCCPSMVASPFALFPSTETTPQIFNFDILYLKFLDSRICLYHSNLLLTSFLVTSIRAISSANIVHNGTSSWISLLSLLLDLARTYERKKEAWSLQCWNSRVQISKRHRHYWYEAEKGVSPLWLS